LAVPLWGNNQSKLVAPGVINTAKAKGSVLGEGQIGYAIGRWMPFVTAGGGVVKIDGQEFVGAVASNVVTNTHSVVTAGLGVNYAVTNNIITGLRYNRVWTSHELYACTTCVPAANIWFNADTVTAVLEYKF
jgi:opacity protein-like surface antigen